MDKKYSIATKQHTEHLAYFVQDYSHQCPEVNMLIIIFDDCEKFPPFLIMLLVSNHLSTELLSNHILVKVNLHFHTLDIFPYPLLQEITKHKLSQWMQSKMVGHYDLEFLKTEGTEQDI